MAITGGTGGFERKYFTGLANVKIVAINPTLKELNDLGLQFEQEPVYISKNDDGTTKVRIDVWCKHALAGLQKMVFYLEDKDRQNQAGDKFEYINKYGQASFATSIEEVTGRIDKNGNKWFSADGVRIAKRGEADIVNMLDCWAQVPSSKDGKRGICQLDTINDIVKGNVAELKEYVKLFSDKKVQVLLGVKIVDGKVYQQIYTKCFARSFQKDAAVNKFNKRLSEPYGGFLADYQNSLEFKEYKLGDIKHEVSQPVIDTTDPGTLPF